MRSRHGLAFLAIAACACGGLPACGGGEDDEESIRGVVRQVFEKPDDPAEFCDLFTKKALDDDSDAKGEGARRACEEEVADSEFFPEKVEISGVKVEGDTAEAKVRVTENGEESAGTVDLDKDGDTWRVDGSQELDIL